MMSWLRKLRHSTSRLVVFSTAALLLPLVLTPRVFAQGEDLSDGAADPVRLFERGQNAHARGETEKALEFYQEAIKLRPEFPEAEFQRGSVLVSLERLPEAEAAFRRSIELRKDWSLPYSSLGTLLMRSSRDPEAEGLLRLAIKLDAHNDAALRALAEVRLRAADPKEAAQFAKLAIGEKDAPASAWALLALAERGLGDKVAAKTNLDRALEIEPGNIAALVERADLSAEAGDYERAIADLKTAAELKPNDKQIRIRLLGVYERAGKIAEADLLAQSMGIRKTPAADSTPGVIKVLGTPEEIEAANNTDPAVARKALEALLQKNPRNAMLLAKLGASYRLDDPGRSLDFYRRANEVESKNPEYATGYAAALVQARRFADAVGILRQVTAAVPDNYVAHANLATALYELRRFAEALPEYEWLLSARPDRVVTYFFIATAHDKLGEFEDALIAYETFLAQADAKTNQLEIEKVQLRLPSLKHQIKLKQGVKRKQ
jgi:tetratricopeptide (TPR) repeat protein